MSLKYLEKMAEIFKPIPNFPNYEVSNLGRVKALSKIISTGNGEYLSNEKIMSNCVGSTGYYVVNIMNNEFKKQFKVHQLVAMVFYNHELSGMKLVVNHINNIKLDNRAINLEIITQRENTNQKHLKSASNYLGVTPSGKKYRVAIKINGKTNHLGSFNNERIASAVYQHKLESLSL